MSSVTDAPTGDTAAWDRDGAGAARTTGVETPGGGIPELAWSREDDVEDPPARRAWFVVPVFVVALVAFAVVAGWWAWIDTHAKTALAPPLVAPTTAPPPAPAKEANPPLPTALPPVTSTVTVAPPVASPPSRADQDARFLALLRQRGITPDPGADPASDGRNVCALLAATGMSHHQLAVQILETAPDPSRVRLNLGQTEAFVDAAVAAYCPELG